MVPPDVSCSWTSDLWIDAASPKTWDDLRAFVTDHVSRMDVGERGGAAKPEDCTDRVLASLDRSVVAWKARDRKVHAVVGGVNTGKTMFLRLLAQKHNLEFVQVHEDSLDELKTLLKYAQDTGLDPKSRLWVLEHFDMYDAACKRVLRDAFPRLLKSGPVFLTVWPSYDTRSLQTFNCIQALPWTLPSRLAYLDRFGKPDSDWEESFADAGADLGKTLSMQQLKRGVKTERFSLRLCESTTCGGSCPLCMARRRIPSNARMLVEDTLCPRSSMTKRAMLAETDVDLHVMLLQELVPMATSSLEAVSRALDALSLVDACTDYSTMVKDAFVTGTVQDVCKSSSVTFSSGSTVPIPKCLFGNNRLTPRALSDIERRVLVARGVASPVLRARARLKVKDDDSSSDEDTEGPAKKTGVKKKQRKAAATDLVVLENDSERCDELQLDGASPQTDFRDFVLEVGLFEQAAGCARLETAKSGVGSKRKA